MWYVYYSTLLQKGKIRSGDKNDQISMTMINKTIVSNNAIKNRLKIKL